MKSIENESNFMPEEEVKRQSLEELNLAISVFRKKRALSDIAGVAMKNIFK